MLKTWSRTQSHIALSLEEFEFCATMKTCKESLGVTALAREFSDELKTRVLVAASAELRVAQRQGLGELRHLQTGALWIQE